MDRILVTPLTQYYRIVVIIFVSFVHTFVYAEQPTQRKPVAENTISKFSPNVFTVTACKKIQSQDNMQNTTENPGYKICQNIGTAFFFGKPGYLITLYSVIRDTENIYVISNAGKKIKASVLGCDKTGIISVLKIDSAYTLETVKTGLSTKLSTGEDVLLLGMWKEMALTVNNGSIRDIKHPDGTFIIEASENPGTSGTPVFDDEGNLLGLLAYQIETDGVDLGKSLPTNPPIEHKPYSFVAIQVEYAFVIAKSIINKIEGKCGWLGIFSNLRDENCSGEHGVVIHKIIENSPAQRYGLKINDVIFEFNDVDIDSPVQLIDAVSCTKVGDKVPIKILRDGRIINVDVILSSYPTSLQ